MQAQEIMDTRRGATTEQERQLAEGFSKLGSAEKVFFYEILKGIAGGDSMEKTLIHQPHEYKRILESTNLGQLFDAVPLMQYIRAKYGDWDNKALLMAFAYHVGIADGKRQDRAGRAHK